MLAKEVERVVGIAETCDGAPLDYDDLNAIRADGVVLEGLVALDLVDQETSSRWHSRMARFLEGVRAALPDNRKKIQEVAQ